MKKRISFLLIIAIAPSFLAQGCCDTKEVDLKKAQIFVCKDNDNAAIVKNESKNPVRLFIKYGCSTSFERPSTELVLSVGDCMKVPLCVKYHSSRFIGAMTLFLSELSYKSEKKGWFSSPNSGKFNCECMRQILDNAGLKPKNVSNFKPAKKLMFTFSIHDNSRSGGVRDATQEKNDMCQEIISTR